jgi:NTE family protein
MPTAESGDSPMTTTHALVLGGGGVAGIAWHTGLLTGLADAGVDVTGADLLVGTSAGATVAAQLGEGRPVGEWYRRQVDPALQGTELAPAGMPVSELWEVMIRLHEEVADPAERRRRIGAMALVTDTVAEPVRRAVVEGRLLGQAWPERPVALATVDALTGDRRVFDAGSGADLVDAVAASCAVPGVWPPVTIGGRRYIDGGVFSISNADLAAGYGTVLVLAPMTDPELKAQVEELNASGRALVVSPDEQSLAAFGPNPLDPSVRGPAARAGHAQGTALAPAVSTFWAG